MKMRSADQAKNEKWHSRFAGWKRILNDLKSFANEDDQSWRPRGRYARPLNIDLSWDQDDLSDIQSIQGIPIDIPME